MEIGIGKVVTYQSIKKRLSIHSVLQSDKKNIKAKEFKPIFRAGYGR